MTGEADIVVELASSLSYWGIIKDPIQGRHVWIGRSKHLLKDHAVK